MTTWHYHRWAATIVLRGLRKRREVIPWGSTPNPERIDSEEELWQRVSANVLSACKSYGVRVEVRGNLRPPRDLPRAPNYDRHAMNPPDGAIVQRYVEPSRLEHYDPVFKPKPDPQWQETVYWACNSAVCIYDEAGESSA